MQTKNDVFGPNGPSADLDDSMEGDDFDSPRVYSHVD